ncbi:MAG: hypothetical protein CMH52_12315 [Myxococcales bacterium]|nr:hypothetical protein [Myxococcales bacterium]|tara:strand:+ start:1382 stop:2392 length:1011 start_codon:yes stop_codon:yes gene_type:complete
MLNRILVTGATGFIGRTLVPTLLTKGFCVRILSRPNSNLSTLPTSEIEIAHGVLPDKAAVAQALCGVDGVIHLASLLKVPWKAEFTTVNVAGTDSVIGACHEQDKPPVFVHISSLAAAGPSRSGTPHVEGNPSHPVSHYGRTKRQSERVVEQYADRVPTSIIRPPMVLGGDDQASFPLFKSISRGVHVLPSRRPMNVSAIHVQDLANAMICILLGGERLNPTCPDLDQGLYYAAADEIISYEALGKIIAQLMDTPITVIKCPSWVTYLAACVSEAQSRLTGQTRILTRDKWREATAGHWVCSAERLKSGLGWQPEGNLEARLAQIVAKYRGQGGLD